MKERCKKKLHLLFKITRDLKKQPIDYFVLQFKPNAEKTDFVYCNDPLNNKPIVMTEGVINYDSLHESMDEYKELFLSESILTILLANFAAHPQYSGDLKHLPPPFDEIISEVKKNAVLTTECKESLIKDILIEQNSFLHHKEYAKIQGCSLEKTNLLFINHMFCDNAANYAHYFDDNELEKQKLKCMQAHFKTRKTTPSLKQTKPLVKCRALFAHFQPCKL